MNKDNSFFSAESIKAKLKKEADSSGKDFNFLLLHYFIERLLYRLSISPYANNFILKGGLLLFTILNNKARATRDIDFLAKGIKNAPEELVKIFTEIVAISVNDAVSFDTDKITVERIKEDAEYQGIRIKTTAHLGRSRHILQFDIGFDDVIVPHSVDMIYPTLLDMEPPRIKAYSIESVVAEKFHAFVNLADLNSRMKDFYDIYEISKNCDFDGVSLSEAIKQTFRNRKTDFSPFPMVFKDEFPLLSNKQEQWKAFQYRTGIVNVPADFSDIIEAIKRFLLPVYEALTTPVLFKNKWDKDSGLWK